MDLGPLTAQGKRVILVAKEEALRHHHVYLGPEHILLGLLKDENGIAILMQQTGPSIDQLRGEIERHLSSNVNSPDVDDPPFTPRAKRVLEYAAEEATSLGYNHIGAEHILLGILKLKEQEGTTARVLNTLRIRLAETRQRVQDVLQEPGSIIGEQSKSPSSHDGSDHNLTVEEGKNKPSPIEDSPPLPVSLPLDTQVPNTQALQRDEVSTQQTTRKIPFGEEEFNKDDLLRQILELLEAKKLDKAELLFQRLHKNYELPQSNLHRIYEPLPQQYPSQLYREPSPGTESGSVRSNTGSSRSRPSGVNFGTIVNGFWILIGVIFCAGLLFSWLDKLFYPDKEALAWKEAQKLNSPESYQKYLDKFFLKESKDAAKVVLNKIEKDMWFTVKEKAQVTGYDTFLQRFPNSIHAEEARQMAQEGVGKLLLSKGATISEYEGYINRYPNSSNIPEVKLKLSEAYELAWKDLHSKRPCPDDYAKFLERYPNAPHAAKIREIIPNTSNDSPSNRAVSISKINAILAAQPSLRVGWTGEVTSYHCYPKETIFFNVLFYGFSLFFIVAAGFVGAVGIADAQTWLLSKKLAISFFLWFFLGSICSLLLWGYEPLLLLIAIAILFGSIGIGIVILIMPKKEKS